MHQILNEKVEPFLNSMPKGAIYLEFLDGSVVAYSSTTPNNSHIHSYIALKTKFGRNPIVKEYYKSYDILNNGNLTQWVNLGLYKSTTSSLVNMYTTIFTNRNLYKVDEKNIKEAFYTDNLGVVSHIREYDGIKFDNIVNNILISQKDKNLVDTRLSNFDNPTATDAVISRDIKISLKDNRIQGGLNNTLVWLNGMFVSATKFDDKTVFIRNALSIMYPERIGFKPNSTLNRHSDNTAAVVFNSSQELKGYVFDLKIFKWDNLKIDTYGSDYQMHNDVEIEFNTNKVRFDYLSELSFEVDVDENSLILCNGVVLPRNSYRIGGNGNVQLLGTYNKLLEVIDDYKKEYGNNLQSSTVEYLESLLPGISDYKLVKFSSLIPNRTVKLHRDSVCRKNYPYPFHVNFPEINVGDMILIDGAFEKYTIHSKGVIKYPLTDYISRYPDKNLLNSSNVERVWFTETV